jgi:hypothetical protein
MSQRSFVIVAVLNIILSIWLGYTIEDILVGLIIMELMIFFMMWVEDRMFEKP